MLKISPSPTFTAPVRIHVPGGEDVSVQFVFAHKGRAALQEYMDRARSVPDLDALSEIVTGWSGVDAEFSRDNLGALLDSYPSAAVAILEGYITEIGRAAAKN